MRSLNVIRSYILKLSNIIIVSVALAVPLSVYMFLKVNVLTNFEIN